MFGFNFKEYRDRANNEEEKWKDVNEAVTKL